MSTSSFHEMKECAIVIEKGMRDIENFLCWKNQNFRNLRGYVNDTELKQATSLLQCSVMNIRTAKFQLRSGVCGLKTMSQELKLLLENVEAEKKRIGGSLKNMAGVLRPGEPLIEDITVSFMDSTMASSDTLSLEPELSGNFTSGSFPSGSFFSECESLESFSPQRFSSLELPGPAGKGDTHDEASSGVLSSSVNESVTIQVTPVSESKVQKSHCVDQRDVQRKLFEQFGRMMVRQTHSPSHVKADTSVENRLYGMETPTKCAESKKPETATTLEKYEMPVLSDYISELLVKKFAKSLELTNTPS